MKTLVPEHIRIDRLRDHLLSDMANYQRNPHVYGSILRDDFYHVMNSVGEIRTGYYTKEAIAGKKGKSGITYDHINAPRRMCDMILRRPELIMDVDKFKEVVQYARFTIGVTEEQNNMVKQRRDGSLMDLSVETYRTITNLWWTDEGGYVGVFPDTLIYPGLTEFEKTLI